jgi:hypothetical protein
MPSSGATTTRGSQENESALLETFDGTARRAAPSPPYIWKSMSLLVWSTHATAASPAWLRSTAASSTQW